MAFIEETHEYLLGRLRRGPTVDGKEAAVFIADIRHQLPGCVQEVLIRADGEFLTGSGQPRQWLLFEDDQYTYRIFCTSLAGPAHRIIEEYDQRADYALFHF